MAGLVKKSDFPHKAFLKLLLAIPVPLVYYLVHTGLSSNGGWSMLLFYELIPLLGLAGLFWKKREDWLKKAEIVIMFILAVIMVGEILILPYQAYELWFNLFRSGIERGRVSLVFVKLAAWLTALVCWIVIQRPSPLQALKYSLYLPLFFIFLLWPRVVTASIFLAALLWDRVNKETFRGLILILILTIFIGMTGVNTKAKGADFIDQSSDKLINLISEIWPSLPILYDVPLYGESLSRSIEDGGRPTLTSNIIMTVTGYPGDQIYLRNRVYAQPGESAKGIKLSELLSAAEPPPGGREITVKIRTDYINMVPYTEGTAVLDMGDKQYTLESKELTLLPEPAIFMDESYTLIESKDRDYPLVKEGEQLNEYLTPSLKVTSDLKQLAEELRGEDSIQTVRNIRSYLISNYTYTLNTRENEEYTQDFLFNSKEGYCLHFASSFVAMARLNGIPSRFVEGYLVNFPSEEEYMENYGAMPQEITTGVSGLSSHIWPEIYLPDRGWVSFEVTAPFVRGDTLTGRDRLTRRQLSEIRGTDTQEEEHIYFWEKIPRGAYLISALILLVAYLFPKVHDLWSKRKNRSSHLVNQYIRAAKKNGISLPQERGWIIWEREIIQNIEGTSKLMPEIMPLILRSRYTQKDLSQIEKNTLRKGIYKFKSLIKESRSL